MIAASTTLGLRWVSSSLRWVTSLRRVTSSLRRVTSSLRRVTPAITPIAIGYVVLNGLVDSAMRAHSFALSDMRIKRISIRVQHIVLSNMRGKGVVVGAMLGRLLEVTLITLLGLRRLLTLRYWWSLLPLLRLLDRRWMLGLPLLTWGILSLLAGRRLSLLALGSLWSLRTLLPWLISVRGSRNTNRRILPYVVTIQERVGRKDIRRGDTKLLSHRIAVISSDGPVL